MLQSLRENVLVRFLAIGGGAYLLWYILYEYVLKPATHLDEWVINQIIYGTSFFLDLFGYSVQPLPDEPWLSRVGIEDAHALFVGENCDGVVLFALFTIFILAFPGPVKHKFWYIPVGNLIVHFVNVLRVTALAMIVDYDPALLEFNHDYTFTILVYGVIFGLWYGWIQYFSPAGKQHRTAEA
jgi:exosortase family protein XrtF